MHDCYNRNCIHAILHGLHSDGILESWTFALRFMAVRRLHGMLGIPVHGIIDHNRSILFGENSGPISQLAHEKSRNLDGHHHLDHTGPPLLHQYFRLGAFYRLQGPGSRPVHRAISQRSRIQHRFDNRLLLDHPCRPIHPLRGYIQDGLRHAEKERGEAEENAIDGRA